jgi:rhodanese-related sulfurtransferase
MQRFTLDDLVAESHAAIRRLTPRECCEAIHAGALLLDTRTQIDRDRYGAVPGSFHTPSTKLLWRCDPVSGYQLDEITGFDHHLIVMCDGGYSSSLAAAQLQRLGFTNATDMIGGFWRWRDDGLPVAPPDHHCCGW